MSTQAQPEPCWLSALGMRDRREIQSVAGSSCTLTMNCRPDGADG